MERWHLVLDMEYDEKFPQEREEQKEYILSYINDVVDAIDMEVIGGPLCVYGSGKKEGAQSGWSVVVIIDYSSICVHHFEESNEVKIDIFSCKRFDKDKPSEISKKYFGEKILLNKFICG